MESLDDLLRRAESAPRALSHEELTRLFSLDGPDERRRVREAAYRVKLRHAGRTVSVRALVEAGNVCSKDCFYCGIRRSNADVRRYRLTVDEIERLAAGVHARGWSSLVLQSGEIASEEQTRFVETCLRRLSRFGLGVTLSLGEQTEETYRRWKEAGAARYLLRVETSNPRLYAALHPADHSWERRVACLDALRRCGYQVGTGVMGALPGQTAEDLARDVAFFALKDVDMIGMGPYIPHPGTPLAASAPPLTADARLETGLDMIAAARLYLHDVNIASTTALRTLAPDGRERGLLAGANVVMLNVTDAEHRARYRLYEGKGETDDPPEAFERALAAIGERPGYAVRGDSPHFFARVFCYNKP
jgi:biotin synthase